MKHLKILGLAAVAAAALMAFAGAGTASADELCTEAANAENMCPAGKQITTVTYSEVGTTRLKLTGGSTAASCTGGSIDVTTTGGNGTGSAAITGTVNNMEFSGCSTTVDTVAGGTLKGEAGAGGGTTLTSIGAEWTLQLFGVSCTYGTGTGVDLGEMNASGELPTFSKSLIKVAGGGLCPATFVWEGFFKATNHTAVHYVSN